MGTSETPGRSPGTPDRSPERDERTGRAAAAQRMQRKHQYVDLQIQEAMKRGDFDNLPGAGKPIKDLGDQHDPDWWLKKLVEREKITGVLPPALQLRKDDAELDAKLDRHTAESEVRRELEEFNARVMKARYTPVDGPPLITMPRDVETEVDAWRERRLARRRAAEAARRTAPEPSRKERPRRRWFRRRRLTRLGLLPDRDVLLAVGGERRAVPVGPALAQPQPGDPRHQVELGRPRRSGTASAERR